MKNAQNKMNDSSCSTDTGGKSQKLRKQFGS